MKKKFLIGCGTPILIVVALIISVIVLGSTGPDTSVYPGHQIPKKFLSTIRSLNLLQEDENIKYFYSDAFVDIRKGLYFVTEHNLVLHSSEWETPAIIIPLNSVATIDPIYNESFFVDTIVHISTSSGDTFSFPVSSEGGYDKKFVHAIKKN